MRGSWTSVRVVTSVAGGCAVQVGVRVRVSLRRPLRHRRSIGIALDFLYFCYTISVESYFSIQEIIMAPC